MKFWQLVSMFRTRPLSKGAEQLRALLSDPRWGQYRAWLEDFNAHVDGQHREILDAVIPDALCRAALQAFGYLFCVKDGYVSLYRPEAGAEPPSQTMTATEVYDRCGPDAIEEILEFSCVRLP